MKRQLSRIIAVVALGMTFCGDAPVARDGDLKKSDLTPAAANAQAVALEDKGYGVKEVQVKSDGKVAKFTVLFSQDVPRGHVRFDATHREVDREIAEAHEHGGVVFTQLKGYRIGKEVYYAFVAALVAPRYSGVPFEAFRDVPAWKYRALCDRHRRQGARIVDYSTYRAPDGREYHTVVFGPR